MRDFFDLVENGEYGAVAQQLDLHRELVKSRRDSGNSALHLAACQGHVRLADLLLGRGAEINAPGAEGKTPLHVAVEGSNFEVTNFLITHGANVNAVDERGLSVLACAAKNCPVPESDEEKKIFDLLRTHGAEYDIISAGWFSDIVGTQEILQRNPDVVKKLKNPEWLLSAVVINEWAPNARRMELLQLLFDHGLRLRNDHLREAIKGCEMHGAQLDIADFLRGKLTDN